MYLRKLIHGLKTDPVGFVKRAFFKTIIGPLKYSKENGYNASQYWKDRFSKYGYSLQGAGDESISSEDNEKVYQSARDEFQAILKQENINLSGSDILEIGVGSAFFTGVLFELGAQKLTGVDITDVLFNQHKEKFPDYTFVKRDITNDTVDGVYDLITMIDVVQHITEEAKVAAAMATIKNCLQPGGKFLIGPLETESQKHHFYVHIWSVETIKHFFDDCNVDREIPFKGSILLVIRKPE